MSSSTKPPTAAARRRGRPQRLPDDPLPISAAGLSCDVRVGWLLASNRLLATDPALRGRAPFIRALGQHGVRVDSPRLSRWESGAVRAPVEVLRAYERALQLPELGLVCVASSLRRFFEDDPTGTSTAAGTPWGQADLEDLIDKALDQRADGVDWLVLAGELTRYDRVLLPRGHSRQLCDQLVGELGVSVGPAHLRRFEAAAVLMRHPSLQRSVSLAVGDFVIDNDTEVVPRVLQLLTEVSGSGTDELIVRLLQTGGRLLHQAASSVAAVKIARDEFAERWLPDLEAQVGQDINRGAWRQAGLDSLDLAVALPQVSWERVAAEVRDPAAVATVTRMRTDRELLTSRHAARIAAVLAREVLIAAPAAGSVEPDLMLHRLVREALLHVHRSRRAHAAQLLAASPYADALTERCLALTRHSDELVAGRAWNLLLRVGADRNNREIARAALAEDRPQLRTGALVNLGLGRERLGHQDAARLADQAGTGPAGIRRASLFVLGMTESPHLAELTRHPDPATAANAAWWVDRGGAVYDADQSPAGAAGERAPSDGLDAEVG